MMSSYLWVTLTLATLFCCSNAGPIILPLEGEYLQLFFYYTRLSVGTPAIPYTVIVDTGSSDLLVPGWGCNMCSGDESQFYYFANSSTGSAVQCGDGLKCKDCIQPANQCQYLLKLTSIEQLCLLSHDVLYIGDGKPFAAPFGAVINISFQWEQRPQLGYRGPRSALTDRVYPNGLWGMAFESLISTGAPSALTSLFASNSLESVYSMCFSATGKGGVLGLGTIVPYFKGPMKYVPLSETSFFGIKMFDFQINGQSLGLKPDVYNQRHCIVDSGTPVVTVPPIVYTTIRSMLEANCTKNPLRGICNIPADQSLFAGKCFVLSQSDLAQYPTFTFTLEGLTLTYKPTDYLRTLWSCKEANMLGLAIQSDSSGFGTVLGLSLLLQYTTVYDMENQRVGFAPSSGCPQSP